MIVLGLDDTDTLDTPGTNQLARRIAGGLPPGFRATLVLRHQLLFDPRIPYTSQNGSASIAVEAEEGADRDALIASLRQAFRDWFVAGSDPGLCVAERVPAELTEFGRRCQREPVTQAEARALARASGVHLEGFGGTEDGVIGALAAAGLLAGGEDGRVVHLPGWSWPDGFNGEQSVAAIRARGVEEILVRETGVRVGRGTVDVGKHLRPSYRGGRVVLLVEAAGADDRWRALKLP
jgi:hypothetical protein